MALGPRKRQLSVGNDRDKDEIYAAYPGSSASHNAEPSSSFRPNQTLPVADLPPDFDGDPLDGAQYLAVVRRQAQNAPTVVYVENPYAAASSSVSSARFAATSAKGELPTEQWRETFLLRFRNMRDTLSNRPKADGGADAGVPVGKNARAWLALLYGDAKEGVVQRREPSSALLARLHTRQILYLLQVMSDAISKSTDAGEASEDYNNDHDADAWEDTSPAHPSTDAIGRLDTLYAQWLFALLAHLDERLVGDDISTLRMLARACISTIAAQRRAVAGHVDIQAELGAWIVVCAIAGIWSQHDLWDDAATTLPAGP